MNLMVIGNVHNFVNHFFTEFNVRNFLIFIVYESDKLVSIHPNSKIINIESARVLLKMNLEVSFGQISHDVAESVPIIEET